MPKMFKKIKKRLAVRLIPFVARNAPDAVNGMIQERAAEMAVKVAMAFLAREGFVTCSMCPSRWQLSKIGSVYACRDHAGAVREKWDLEAKRAGGVAPRVGNDRLAVA